MIRLSKRDVESLLDAIDTPSLLNALRAALAKLLAVEPFNDDWPALVRLAGNRAGWSEERVTRLVEHDPMAMASLATDLNELRTLT